MLIEMKPKTSSASLELIVANLDVGIQVLLEFT